MLIKRFRTSTIEVLKSSTPEGLPLIKNAIAVKEVKPTKEVKEAAGKSIGEIARLPDGRTDLAAEMAKRPNDLWIRTMAIKADEENDNGDFFSTEEIERSYRSFEGCPIFTNHENTKVENAKGKVVMSEWVPEEKAVYCTAFIDREAFAPLCHSIERGYITDVSMGTQVEFSTCSVCNNKAHNADEYCDHVKTMKGRKLNGKKVFERNYGLKFIELSVVTDGACSDCVIQEILDPSDFVQINEQVQKAAASIHRLVKTSGKQELEQLNQCMDLLVNVIQSMLNQRQMIDLEFMKKVADVLAMLQETTDELVDQGYGNAPSPGQEQAAAEPGLPPPGPEMGGMPPPEKEMGADMTNPQGEQPVGSVGRVTEPSTAGTEPVMNKAAKLVNAIKELSAMAQKISTGEVPTQGGTQVSANVQHEVTKAKIANIWVNPSVKDFVTEVSENDLKVIVSKEQIRVIHKGQDVASLKVADIDAEVRRFMEDKPQEFGALALDAFKTKIAAYAPTNTEQQQQQTFEAQLENQKPPLHPREKDPQHQVTEGQLGEKKENYKQHARQNDPKSAITEKQLDTGNDYLKRQKSERDSITELQLRDNAIKGNMTPADLGPNSVGVTDQNQQITEGQLDQATQRGNPATAITEKQLVEDATNWARRIASKEDAKKALAAVQNALVKTAISSGATPDELISLAMEISGSAKSQVQASEDMTKLAEKKDERAVLLKRARFNGPTMQLQVKDYLLGSLADEGFSPEIGLQTLETYASSQNVQIRLAEAIKTGLEPEKEIRPSTAKELLKAAANESEEQVISVVFAKNQITSSNEEEFGKIAFEKAASMVKERGFEAIKLLQIAKKKDTIEVMVLGKTAAQDDDDDDDGGDDDKKGKKGKKDDDKKDDDKKETTEGCLSGGCGKVSDKEARSENRKKVVEAQFGGGLPGAGGGGTPPSPAGGAVPPAAPMGGPPGAPAPVEQLSAPAEAPAGEEAKGEALPPGSICPVCGSDNVDVEKGEFNCNSCGAEGGLFVEFEITKWPGTIEEKGPEKEAVGEEAEEMAETPEIPQLGLAAKYKVTPEMLKVAGRRPVGSWCPRCGSGEVKVAMKGDNGHGKCSECDGVHHISVKVDENKDLWARIAWWDHQFKKFAMKEAMSTIQGSKIVEKRAKLEKALRETKKTQEFAKADLAGKAAIIANLHDKGLIE